MTPQYLLLAIPALLLLVALEMIVDWAKHQNRFSLPDTLTNISCGIGNQGLNLFTEGLKIALFLDLYESFALMSIPATWWALLLCLFLFDIAFYWEHRLSHTINILWGTHVVHHSSEEYNLTIALRRSWIADIIVIVFFLPLPLLGFHPITFAAAVIIHNFYQFIIHTKAVKKLHPVVEYIMHTPSHHRVHHGKDPKYIDKNFSGVFILIDRMFGTFQEEEEEPTYGITTQLKTNNPGLVNLHYYRDLFRKVGQIRSWKDKIRMLFARPGWNPPEMGGYIAPPEVDKTNYRKYQPRVPKLLSRYVAVQFLLNFTAILAFIVVKKILEPRLGYALLPGNYEYLFFLIIFLSSIIPIALFDRTHWLRFAEHGRLALIFVIVSSYLFMHQPQALLSGTALLLVFYLGMAWWFDRVWKGRNSLQVKKQMA